MMARMKWLVVVIAMVVAAHGVRASGSKPGAGVSFHLETEAGANPKLVFEQEVLGEKRWFFRTPEISNIDVEAFSPFPSDDEVSYGLVLRLTKRGASRVAALTNANTGRWLLAMVNGRLADAVIIDQQVDDGFLVIWRGVTPAEIREFDKQRPRLTDDPKKWKKGKSD